MTNNLNEGEDPQTFILDTLATVLSGGKPEDVILEQEARGQRKLVASDLLPTEMLRCSESDIEALGIELGDVVEDDPLFRYAKLPEGWTKRPTDHDMWSEVVDADGTPRIAIFYKAAFYDRRAHMSLDQIVQR